MGTKLVDSVEEWGNKSKAKKLTADQISFIAKLAKPYAEALTNNCDSHALFRYKLTCENGILFTRLDATDINGTIKELVIMYDLDDEDADLVLRGTGFTLNNKTKVLSTLLDLARKVGDVVPFEVGLLDVPLEGGYNYGVMMPYIPEPGTFLIKLESDKDFSYLIDNK